MGSCVLKNKYNLKGLEKVLKKAKNGDEVKEIYGDYVGPLLKAQRVLRALVDDERVVPADQKNNLLFKKYGSELFDENIAPFYFAAYIESSKLRDMKQTYLFKFDEPAE